MDLEQATAYVASIGKAAFPRFSTDDWRAMAVRTFRPRSDGLLELDYDPAVIRTTRPWLLWLLRPVLWRAVRGLTARVPVLVVRGALSDILPADVARQMAATSERARLVEVPDVGHAPMLSEPEARDAILALLERPAAVGRGGTRGYRHAHHAGNERRLRRRHWRPQLDPRRSAARAGGAARWAHHRARFPAALAHRAGRRGGPGQIPRYRPGTQLRPEQGPLPGAGTQRHRGTGALAAGVVGCAPAGAVAAHPAQGRRTR
ncbi:hypothetical protein G6F31_015197 [Rhizopus arrhizus]|nr:hypothetical protein G6F31_015197 [Rhizopus arrhizus]